jgi:hypothetical protein
LTRFRRHPDPPPAEPSPAQATGLLGQATGQRVMDCIAPDTNTHTHNPLTAAWQRARLPHCQPTVRAVTPKRKTSSCVGCQTANAAGPLGRFATLVIAGRVRRGLGLTDAACVSSAGRRDAALLVRAAAEAGHRAGPESLGTVHTARSDPRGRGLMAYLRLFLPQ